MKQNYILVTGGAGYIGSHACKALQQAGFVPVTLDNLVTGWQEAVKFGPFEQGDLLNRSDIDRVFKKYAPVAVMHFAALSQVGENMHKPGRFWRGRWFEFGHFPLFQHGRRRPRRRSRGIPPDGNTFDPADFGCYRWQAGCINDFGTDYDTPDGTCIRDYVHACDLVDAHVLGLKWLQSGHGSRVFNLGIGDGFSVRQVIDHAKHVTNRPVLVIQGARRPGDCTKLVSGSLRAKTELGWSADRSNLKQMITDAWRWHQSGGFNA